MTGAEPPSGSAAQGCTAELTALLRALAPAQLPLEDTLLAALREAYASPGRVYHDLAHVGEVARHFADAARAVGWRQPRETYLAALFHDAVYAPGAADNELRSAELARSAIARWLAAADLDAERVSALIRLTAHHGALRAGEVDAEAALFLDCDMAILGSAPQAFDAYDAAIAAEYRAIPPERFAAGRRAFAQRLLASERIFLSEHFRGQLETRARANLERLLARLPAGGAR